MLPPKPPTLAAQWITFLGEVFSNNSLHNVISLRSVSLPVRISQDIVEPTNPLPPVTNKLTLRITIMF